MHLTESMAPPKMIKRNKGDTEPQTKNERKRMKKSERKRMKKRSKLARTANVVDEDM